MRSLLQPIVPGRFKEEKDMTVVCLTGLWAPVGLLIQSWQLVPGSQSLRGRGPQTGPGGDQEAGVRGPPGGPRGPGPPERSLRAHAAAWAASRLASQGTWFLFIKIHKISLNICPEEGETFTDGLSHFILFLFG